MGFRDLVIFNQAMLARQGWRILTDPNSLCSRVLKGRYFLDSDFWSAPKPRSASFTWRSILFGRELLKKGVRWAVGDGSTIKITKDKWIPGVQAGMVNTRFPIPDDVTVDWLMNPERNAWDEEIVKAVFNDDIAREVLQVPISRHGGEDFVSWPHDKRGLFTVRSAYNLVRSNLFVVAQSSNGRGQHSGANVDSQFWKALWTINAPGKMLIHLWRSVHDCLPTGFQLRRRHVPATEGCIFCGHDDRIEHVFLVCPFAATVWDAIKEKFQINLCRRELCNMRQWVFDFLTRSSHIQKTVLAVTLRHIWEARNFSRNNPVTTHPRQVIHKIVSYVDMIVQHCPKDRNASGCDLPLPVTKWKPPPPGMVLINSDAALFQASNQTGLAFVIRDHSATCMLAANKRITGLLSPELAEALVIRFALEHAKAEGFQNVLMASDCLSVIKRIQSGARDLSVVGVIVRDIKKLETEFLECSFIV